VAADRIREFRRVVRVGASDRVIPTPHGVGLLFDAGPQVYDANYLWVERPPVGATELAAEADGVLADRFHRRVVVSDPPPGLAGEFDTLGYALSAHLVLVHRRPPDRRVDTRAVREAALDELIGPRTVTTLREPWGDAEIAEQLAQASRRIADAVPTRHYAAIADGEVAGWCELYLRDGVAQIENVEVLQEFRGRGLGRAVVQHALDVALREADVVFLEALADDWPRELYAKLGFVAVDRSDFYTRLPPPLSRLRLRTPRLELRLATEAELRRLYLVAEAGIHDPAVMPFEIPWTDSLNEEEFLAYHRERQELVVFLDGDPVGVQAVRVTDGVAATGSWLGAPHQGHGLGTEMRAAVLTYAFDHLGATVARSGALAGNEQSLGVSRKLGYRIVGSRTFAPRGEPVEHTDVELRREDFRSPVPVEVVGT
jgi:RimJ/RimL family protein N-acetyltransferase/N-acetylglutamate synthase-like GNAT family acetyltransferase